MHKVAQLLWDEGSDQGNSILDIDNGNLVFIVSRPNSGELYAMVMPDYLEFEADVERKRREKFNPFPGKYGDPGPTYTYEKFGGVAYAVRAVFKAHGAKRLGSFRPDKDEN